MKRHRIARVIRILTAFQAEKVCTIDDLAKMFGTSRRTLFRDLEQLRTMGVPYHYDAKTGGYWIDSEYFLPPLDLTLQEALSLLLLVHSASDQIQLPFRDSAFMAALKIENNLRSDIRRYCGTALKRFSVKAGAQASMNQLEGTLTPLLTAIQKKRKVEICYHSLFEGGVIETELCPYHLMYNHRAWYVIGKSGMHGEVRTFKFNRIKSLKVLSKGFVDSEDFNLDEYLGRAWSMIPEGKIYNIKLRFLPKVASNVTEVRWHDTQQVTRNADGSATVEYRVDGLGEIGWWILGYGDQVEVIKPKALRDRILKAAKNIVKFYEQV